MKTKDLSALRSKTSGELDKMVSDLRIQIARFTLEMPLRRQKNTNLVKNLKRSLAQVLTIKTELEGKK